MKIINRKKAITKSAPRDDEELFQRAVDQFWQDVFRELHGAFMPSAQKAFGEELEFTSREHRADIFKQNS